MVCNALLQCKCCLTKYPRCHRFCTDPKARWAMLVLGVFLLAFLIYAIWAIIELLKIKNTITVVDIVEVPALCSSDIPFLLTANLSNPSKLGIGLTWASVTLLYVCCCAGVPHRDFTLIVHYGCMCFGRRRKGDNESLGWVTTVPEFIGHGTFLPPGKSVIAVETIFHAGTPRAVGEMVSQMLRCVLS